MTRPDQPGVIDERHLEKRRLRDAEVAAEKERNLICRMAGNIAPGLLVAVGASRYEECDRGLRAVADDALMIARAIAEGCRNP